jgi:putative phosphoribosyl transferase
MQRSTRADVVLGLPRGGVPVAAEVALALGAPLDVIVVRKLGTPGQRELAMGALGEDGIRVVHDEVIRALGISADDIAAVERRERAEVEARTLRIRTHRPRIDLRGRHVVIADDGLATGSTARAACLVARAHGATHVTLAMPVAPVGWDRELGDTADEYVAASTPAEFSAVGNWYHDFSEVPDEEVTLTLHQPTGQLLVPEAARGVVVFAHGSGSSHSSPRNRHVAGILRHRGFGTVLIDLLSPEEERERANVFDIELLGERLAWTIDWVRRRPDCESLPLSLFGASTGAAAALRAAAENPAVVSAIVSRGGRPDLAHETLGRVEAPTLLIVGALDTAVLQLNRDAAARLRCDHALAIVPGATHLFEEPGTLDEVAVLAADWFERFGSR